MSDTKDSNEVGLEWIKLKSEKGQKPDFIVKDELNENIENKFIRKFKENPFVPIGSVITLGFLGVGLKSMYDGNKMKSQMMMRGRIAAQGFTVIAILGGLFLQGLKALKEAEKDEQELAALK